MWIYDIYRLEGLASNVQDRQVPFKRIAEKQSDFIASKYIPRSLQLKDPRTMKREDMVKFFDHVRAREASHGAKDAFRFKAILSSRKKGFLEKAKYSDCVPDSGLVQNSELTSTREVPAPNGFTMNEMPEWETLPDGFHQFSVGPNITPTPSITQDWTFQSMSEPNIDPTERSRPKPRPVTRTQQSNPAPDTLSLDPSLIRDPPILLDSSFDPALPGTSTSNRWLQLPSADLDFPSLSIPQSHDVSPRQRSKSADRLAIEEAQRFVPKGKSRR